MLVKFESKSSTAKCIAFHPKRARALVALKTSFIQLWDYRMGTLVHRFDGHTGVVRCVDFHPSQNMFVSCGDDGTVRVWNLSNNECMFVLDKHFDYVRTCFFHPELPWIISASDDQTIRIWNWQNRQEIACLTGHSHWVTCAQFHPTEDLIVSASMDMTVRVWDMSALRKRHSAPGSQEIAADDVFGADCVVKYVLEGHDRGVNWAAFHPTQQLVVSGADDRTVRVWRYAETRAWELDTCRGHTNNVTCAVFAGEYIVSCSDDRSIRTWDLNSRACVQTYKTSDKFWNVGLHPTINLLGATHDSGVMIFKLNRERPAATLVSAAGASAASSAASQLLYVTPQKVLKEFSLSDPVERQGILSLKKVGQLRNPIIELSYNPAERAVLATSTDERGPVYALCKMAAQPMGPVEPSSGFSGAGDQALFVSRNRFVVFTAASQLLELKDLQNATTKTVPLPIVTKRIVAAPQGLLLLGAQSVVLFDLQQAKVLAKLSVPNVKYAAFSGDGHIALQSKHNLTITDANLKQLSQVYEVIRIKSVGWDRGVVFYTTFNHLKYALLNGDSGVLKSLSQTLYVHQVYQGTVVCLSRTGQAHIIRVDPTEYKFKRALVEKNFGEVARLIRDSNLVGQSIIAYLQKRGFPEVAMQFVQDPQTKFDLAIECGNLEVATQQARVLNKPVADRILGVAALEQGNHDIVEDVYQKQADLDKLAFLYLATGNKSRLQKLQQIAEARNDASSRFQTSLFLQSVEGRISLLREAGMAPLAYSLAKSSGLSSLAAEILAEAPAGVADIAVTDLSAAPQLGVAHETWKSVWPVEREDVSKKVLEAEIEESSPAQGSAHGSASVASSAPGAAATTPHADVQDTEAFDDWDMDVEVDDEPEPEAGAAAAFTEPATWVQGTVAAHHIAAGSFETAMQLLNRQIGAVNFAPLKPRFLQVYQASRLYLEAADGLPPLEFYALKAPSTPIVPGFDTLNTQIQEGYRLFRGNKVELALECFRDVLKVVATLSVSAGDVQKCRDIVTLCRDYILAFTIELRRRALSPDDTVGNLKLASYFTVPKLRPAHQALQYMVAAKQHFSAKNFASAAHFAAKFLEVAPSDGKAEQMRRIAAKQGRDEVDVGFDAFSACTICPGTLTPIYDGQPFVLEPFTGARYQPSEKGKLDVISQISEVGAVASGLNISV